MTDLTDRGGGTPGGAVPDDVAARAARACDTEPIRVPGSVQPHGVLLALRPDDLAVAVASTGAERLVGRPAPDLLGAALADLLPDAVPLARAVASGADDVAASPRAVATPTGAAVDVLAHRSEDLVVLELEPAADGAHEAPWHHLLPVALRRLQEATSAARLCEVLASEVRRLTGFDRVMVYRFDDAWNGEVVAEDRREDLEPFLGLHYPASDIPAQARALYATQWLRIIADVEYLPAPLVPPLHPGTGAPLDLSQAGLRSVSPVHLQYLRNMGVAASMSISLLHEGRLWGLVACHHCAGAHRPAQPVRSAAEFLGRTASLLLPTVQRRDSYEAVLASAAVRSRLTELLAARPDLPLEALTREETTLADLVPCGGAAVRLHGELRLLGSTPDAADVLALAERLGPEGLVTSALAEAVPELAGLSAAASGVLAAPLAGGRPGDLVAWFRPEVLREVTWGGDPRSGEVVVDGEDGPRLSPRASFAAWSELVRRTATPWAPHEVEVATAFARHLSDSLLREVERTSRLATALQQTLLLERLPDLPQVDVAVRYSPHSDDVVGGDWYDVIPLASGRVAIALGDVAGHGLAVSAISAQMRNGLRAYLLSTEDPGQALSRLNDLVVSLLPGELATAVVAVLDPGTGAVDVANAGHPPLVRLGAGGTGLLEEEARGPALGLVAGVDYASARLHLDPGELLLLYSDGLVEERSGSWDERIARLLDAVAAPSDDLDAYCERLVGTVSAHADDTTVLALRSVR
ncbi:SpoIIE family protein phosphatase [Quadrisphaera sp. DSM 44207]|uniref:SpoIIE family protein phosphatase n=1 Tax=Quadrisphaera sp. DSM 44207 TaxID=1881057 RepID=UPI00088AA9DE|nr:SpoIIE family protein phosphatase [Quadrisphaera sp. DSM 44207]SDQ37186.1 PAS fold-containing protein [Quadrisphaera sp. DSM 44207]